jgi:hypothetical protein
MRYFYGKQLRLADYVDEQRYHAGKMRFHNERLHGAGILCGLRVSLLDPGGLVLRVGRGAAVDDCGREILVGYDQCVDVDAWFKAQKRKPREPDEADPCHPDPNNRVRVCVLIRYSECAQAPEPAPRNPCAPPSCGCGCPGGSCSCSDVAPCPDPCGEGAEFGRVTEQFDLRLAFHDEAMRLTEHRLFPTREAIDTAAATASQGIGLLQSLAAPIREGCPGSDEEWLLLACFYAVVDANDGSKIVEVCDIDYDCASQVLLSTEVIQYLLASLYAEMDPNIGGPEVTRVQFRRLSNERYQFILVLTGPIDPASLDPDDSFAIRRLRASGWTRGASESIHAEYSDTQSGNKFIVDGPAIYVTVKSDDNFLAAGKRYNLYVPPETDPVVDQYLRPLRSRFFNWRFGLEADNNGRLVMTTLPPTMAI